MAKRGSEESVNVQGRLKLSEVARLDKAAESQPIPVTRAALVSFILRKWLREQKDQPKGRAGGK